MCSARHELNLTHGGRGSIVLKADIPLRDRASPQLPSNCFDFTAGGVGQCLSAAFEGMSMWGTPHLLRCVS